MSSATNSVYRTVYRSKHLEQRLVHLHGVLILNAV